MGLASWIGTSAAIASTVSFAPQALKIIQDGGKTKEISATMYVITVAAFALWASYGVLLSQWPLIVSNGICLLLSGFILLMKLLPKQTAKRLAENLYGRSRRSRGRKGIPMVKLDTSQAGSQRSASSG